MLNNAKVIIGLKELEVLIARSKACEEMNKKILECFEVIKTLKPNPEECNSCTTDVECNFCEIYLENPPYSEKLIIDVDRLIKNIVYGDVFPSVISTFKVTDAEFEKKASENRVN